MRNILSAFFGGIIFSLGLGISGMTQPQKVVGFLNVFGNWDPSLMFVMIGAIGVHMIAYKFIMRQPVPLFTMEWHLPDSNEITKSLMGGAIIFGIGWGLGGYCPGPAITALASMQSRPFVFVMSMIVGMFVFHQADKIFNFDR
jgi:uncharacterized protein